MATPPPGVARPASRPAPARYTGPPAYHSPPRWGFPVLAWRWPTSVGDGEPDVLPIDRVRSRARLALSALWVLAVAAVFAACAEVYRYALLVQGRTAALSRSTVDLSDALVVTGSVLAVVAGALSILLTLWWVLTARLVAADLAGYSPARPDWQIVPSLFIPGVNLVVPGEVMAELEHAALARPADERPRPSTLLRWWWATLAASGLLFTATLLWRLRDSAQALADGVLLTAVTDLVAAALAVLTVVVVSRLTASLTPVEAPRLLRVVSVSGVPDVAERAERPAGAVR